MSERKPLIMDQITNSILCMITAIPVIWLLNKYTILSTEYLVCYYCLFLFTGVLLAVFDHLRWLYRISILIPVAVLLAFRDIPLFLNCLAGLALFIGFMLLYRWKHRRHLIVVITVLLLVLCLISGDMSRVTAAAIAGLIILCLSLYAKSNIRYVLTVMVLIECIALCINVDAAKRVMAELAGTVGQIVSTMEDHFNDVKYYLGQYDNASYTGYDEPGGMFQTLKETSREELYIKIEGKITNIYLKGASYYSINKDGVEGRIEETLADNSWFAWYLNDLYHAGITKEEAESFSKIQKANVEYEYIKTTDIMHSTGLLLIDQDQTGNVLGKGDIYSFRYLTLDYANPYLTEVVRQSAQSDRPVWESYDTIREYADALYDIPVDSFMDESAYNEAYMTAMEELSDERYLDDSFVTDRIRELSMDITKDCTNDYDRARMIEAYLRQYPYDTNVDYRGTDHYVETFLFDEERGYCTHYASAMVVMLRSIGIPAKYTQGFKHDTANGNVVYSNEAHAWPEAYIRGYGWIAFEPTGAYASAAETGWGLLPKDEMESEITTDRTNPMYKETSDIPDIPTQQEDTIGDASSEAAALRKNILELIWQIGRYLVGLIGIVLLFYLIYRIYESIRYQRMSAADKVRTDITHIRRKLTRRLPSGTKVESVFDLLPYVQLNDFDLNEIFTNYYRIRFRGDEPEPEYVAMIHRLATKRVR